MKKNKTLSLLVTGALLVPNLIAPIYASENNFVKWSKLIGSTGGTSASLAYSDTVSHVETLIDGNLLVAGTFDGNKVTGNDKLKGKSDGYIAKYSTTGEEIFSTLIGGNNAEVLNYAIASNHGGYVAVGYTQSNDQDFDTLLKGGKDGFVVKLDEEGKIEKLVTFGGTDADEFKMILNDLDGGYIAVGYTHSTNGDLENIKDTTDRDAVIVKYDQDLNIQWTTTVGGSQGSKMDEFNSVVRTDDGYFAVGYANSNGDDLEGIHLGKKDILVVKFDESGKKLWVKTYGGSLDDTANIVLNTARNNEDGGRARIVQEDDVKNQGLIIAGSTASTDGTFTSKENEGTSSFILRLDYDGNVIFEDTLASTSANKATGLKVVEDGFVLSGTYSSNDLDFTGQHLNGKQNVYVSYYSKTGNRLNINSFGGNNSDEVLGIERAANEDYIVFGKTTSNNEFATGLQGKVDGFIAAVDGDQVLSYTTEKYLVPVKAIKAKEDSASMMAPMLYEKAYVEKEGDQYLVTFYFQNATIMGSTVSSKTLGAVSYDDHGTLVPALYDEYDEKTQIKTIQIRADSLDDPIGIHIEDAMGDIRLSFSFDQKEETETPPYFEPVEITVPDFDASYKTAIGGSDYDYVNDAATLANGNTVIVGQTYSNDGDFENIRKGGSSGFVLEYDQNHNIVNKMLIGGTEYDSIAYISGIAPTDDGGYFIAGSYSEGVGVDPTGDFASLNTEGSVHGKQDTFIARYNANHEQLWIKGFSGSEYDQAKSIKATPDGGSITLIETNSNDGDMLDKNAGLFDLALVKYDESGNLQWTQYINGRNIESSHSGIDVLANGNYVVAGIYSSTDGTFADADRYGNLFDLFACEVDQNGNILSTHTYGGDSNEYFNEVKATSDGGFIMVGDTKSSTDTFAGSAGYDNAYVLKCNANFEKEWVKVLKSTDNSDAISVVETNDNYYVLGDTRGNDFDFENLSKGNMDVFLAQLDKSGNLLEINTIGGVDADYAVRLNQINNYQLGILTYSESTNGDFTDMNRGKFDGDYFVYDFTTKPEDSKVEISSDSNPISNSKQDLVFTFSQDVPSLISILVDGKAIDISAYVKVEGNTITISKGYLATLSAASHAIVFHFANGQTVNASVIITKQTDNLTPDKDHTQDKPNQDAKDDQTNQDNQNQGSNDNQTSGDQSKVEQTSSNGSSSQTTSSVNTSDTTTISSALGLFVVSLFGALMLRRKKSTKQ